MATPIRIAMWSGPRNISTAMLRSWGSRADTAVCDEPFYARYLKLTDVDHPGREQVIAAHETDFARIVGFLTGPVPAGRHIFYQKHMAHHSLAGDDMGWTDGVANCFLVRDPREVIASFIKIVPNPPAAPEQLGYPQQIELLRRLEQRGIEAPVVDARDVLMNPRGILERLCERIGVGFDEAMLRWAPGARDTDGVWGPSWYDSVYRSTGFEPYRPKQDQLPAHLEGVHAECRRMYDLLHERRITCPA